MLKSFSLIMFICLLGVSQGLVQHSTIDKGDVQLNLAMVQFTAVNGNKTANLDQFEAYAQQASARNVSLLVFPELSLDGYSIYSELHILELAEPVNGPSMERVQQIAQQYEINIAYGYMELGEANDCKQVFPPFQNNIYDSFAIISSTGELLVNYRKTHLAPGAEEHLFTRGGVIGPVVEVQGIKIGVMICIEVFTPEIARALALQGAQMILAPTANAYPPSNPNEPTVPYYNIPAYVMVAARASENRVPICYVNYYDPENKYFTFNGMTVLYGSGGNLISWVSNCHSSATIHLRFTNYIKGGTSNSTVVYSTVPISTTSPQEGRRPNLYQGLCSANNYKYCSDTTESIPVAPYP